MGTLDGISRIGRGEGGVVGWLRRRIFVVERGNLCLILEIGGWVAGDRPSGGTNQRVAHVNW